jgi:uncharacterized protein (TIGR02594 family)
MTNYPWTIEARKYLGLHEVVGSKHDSIILGFWIAAKTPWFKDDETPWCAGFACACLENSGVRSPRSASASSFRDWGQKLNKPAYGCFAFKPRYNSRGKYVGGHVTQVVGIDKNGNLLCLGGNQDNMVSIVTYKAKDFTSFTFPKGFTPDYKLPVFISASNAAGTEA